MLQLVVNHISFLDLKHLMHVPLAMSWDLVSRYSNLPLLYKSLSGAL
jgi:hypothetical protein